MGETIEITERGSVGVPALPGSFTQAGIVLSGAERMAIGILQEEGADFIGGGWKHGPELAEGLAVGIEKFPP